MNGRPHALITTSPRQDHASPGPVRATAKTLPALRVVAEGGEENLRSPRGPGSSGPDHAPEHISKGDPTNGSAPIHAFSRERWPSRQLRRHQLGDLCRVERRTLTQIVPAHEELERGGVVE